MAINTTIIILIFSFSFHPWTSSAFRLKLVHRDSPLSPLFQPNLSDFQRFSKNTEISESRASYLKQQTNKAKQKAPVRLPARLQEPLFTVEIGMGTPSVKRTLIFDTGSGLTWTQCRPCLRCFRQNDPLFEPERSSSYKPLDRNHPLSGSFTCTPFGCTYYIGYYSGQYTSGNAAVETFTFRSNPSSPAAAIPNLVFGCGTSNVGNYLPTVSGILGMDKTPVSFVRQLGGLSKGRFSYCLSNTTTSYVRFGDEARIRGWWTSKKTPFSRQFTKLYGLNLIDLSIDGRKLRLTQAAFSDGCIIDSGSSITMLNSRAYSAVTNMITKYFAMFKNLKRSQISEKYLCYSFSAGFASFPSMTFHFKGADLHVPWSNLFFFRQGNVFCMAIVETKDMTVLGAFQQRNVRFVYNLKDNMLSFAPEDCSKDVRFH